MPIKLSTYNVNGVNGRAPLLTRVAGRTAPDIVCLQELKTDDTKFPARALEDAAMERYGMDKSHTTALQFSPEAKYQRKYAVACRATTKTSRLATSKPKSTDLWSPRSIFQMATRSRGEI